MQLRHLVEAMEEIAPMRYAEAWDNVGLLTGDLSQALRKVLLTIDYTNEVAEEGKKIGCDAVVAYHPPIFGGLKRITAENVVYDAIRRGVGIYSPHTALDAADGGTNDVLADALGLADRQPLKVAGAKGRQYKMVVFVPGKDVERVSEAMFNAGAGQIGKYSKCSFRSEGKGTFFGEEGTRPVIGEAGRLEIAEEVRVEMVVTISQVDAVIQAIRETHPYEEPAFDLVQLAPPPETKGMGRIGRIDGTPTGGELCERLKNELGIKHLLTAGPMEGIVKMAAVCAGAGGEFVDEAILQKADLYLTGELRHHDAIKANRAGMAVICTLHSNSERMVLGVVAEKLRGKLAGIEISISRADRDPFTVV